MPPGGAPEIVSAHHACGPLPTLILTPGLRVIAIGYACVIIFSQLCLSYLKCILYCVKCILPYYSTVTALACGSGARSAFILITRISCAHARAGAAARRADRAAANRGGRTELSDVRVRACGGHDDERVWVSLGEPPRDTLRY